MSEQDKTRDEPTTGGPGNTAPLIDPAGQHYWDGHAWQPLPTRRHAAPAASAPREHRTRRRLLAVVAAVVALAVAVGGVVFWQARSGNQAATAKREAAYRGALEHMRKDDPRSLTDDQFADALAFGYDACAKFEAGMTYEEALDIYGPDADAPVPASADAWLDQTAAGVAQILVVVGTLAAADDYLCPEAGISED